MIPKVLLLRLETSHRDGTLGVLYVNGIMTCFSLEPPMDHNLPNISCIPSGSYQCVKDNHGKHKHYKVLNVQGRSNIEFHTGNIWHWDDTITHTQGCILTGSKLGICKGKRGIQGGCSGEGMESFKKALGNAESFTLEIVNCIQGN